MQIQGIPEIIQHPKFIESFEIIGDLSWQVPLTQQQDRTDLLLVQTGRGECRIDEMIVSVAGGDVVMVTSGKSCEVVSSAQSQIKGIVVSFAGLQVSGLPHGRLTPPNALPVISLSKDFSSANRYFTDIHSEARNPVFGSQELVESLLKAVLILLLRNLYQAERDVSPSIASTVKAYIEEHFDQDLTLIKLASLVHVSPYHLAHLFKEEMGISPIKYLIQCRIEEAKRLLTHTSVPISEIASKVGYPNSIYFNLIFKKMTGVPPGKYRKKSKR